MTRNKHTGLVLLAEITKESTRVNFPDKVHSILKIYKTKAYINYPIRLKHLINHPLLTKSPTLLLSLVHES